MVDRLRLLTDPHGSVDLAKLGGGSVWHFLVEERHVEETERNLAAVHGVGLCGAEGELHLGERGLDPNVIRHAGAKVCSRCIARRTEATPVAAESNTKEQDMTTTDTKKISSREAIRLAFTEDIGPNEAAKTADICEAAAKYATSLGFNPRHQLEATLHAQARKDDGVVVRAGRGLFRLRQEETAPEETAPVEEEAEVIAEAEEAKPPARKRTSRKPRASRKKTTTAA